eukprot:CAMPEP_0196802150 /NCGR_PEP_ID=MMETSP1362-20130617/1825_1 /TAXON_ID=163516 /ORGANISM="Leptocylindrus danicus, Strain CCMP1856" /LENGTH=461 /DNA_ID=CAMNT_0042173367 /DNA_START=389 /DNA_END=1774 /DNA_ORIENTATION=-
MADQLNFSPYPQRVGEADCRDYLRTGRCKYGESCKYHHPPNVQNGGGIASINPSEPPFPLRPGEPACQYFLKHGTCKFGQTCKFHHPPTKSQSNMPELLPQRPGEPDCIYFLRNGRCKYGATCKYHHPLTQGSVLRMRSSSMGSMPDMNTQYVLVEPANLVMIQQGNGTSFAIASNQNQQYYTPASPVIAANPGGSPMITSLASSYETAVSSFDYANTSWHAQAQRRARLNSFSSALSLEEQAESVMRRSDGSASNLQKHEGLMASSLKGMEPEFKRHNQYDDGLNQMTSALLNMLDHEESPQQTVMKNEYASPMNSPGANSMSSGMTPISTRREQTTVNGDANYCTSVPSVRSRQPHTVGSPYGLVNQVPDPPASVHDRGTASTFGGSQRGAYGKTAVMSHESQRPMVSSFDDSLFSHSVPQDRQRSLSSVMEEVHAQNWSPNSWQPSSSLPPNTFFPRV